MLDADGLVGKDLAEVNLLVAQTGVTAAGFWHLSSSTAVSVALNCRVPSTFFPSEREVAPRSQSVLPWSRNPSSSHRREQRHAIAILHTCERVEIVTILPARQPIRVVPSVVAAVEPSDRVQQSRARHY